MATNFRNGNAPARRDCRIQGDLANVHRRAKDLQSAMGRLRRNLENCQDCDLNHNCPWIERLNVHVAEAIREINDEFHLEQYF